MDEGTISTTAVEKIMFVVEGYIPRKLAKDFAIKPSLRVFLDQWLDGVIIQVRQGILSQQIDNVVISHPADWWQAVKEEFAPEWFLERWPVEENKTVVDVRAVYPKMALPDEVHFPLVRMSDNGGPLLSPWADREAR